MRLTGALIIAGLAAGLMSGCNGPKTPAKETLFLLEQENARLQRTIVDQEKQIEQLQTQIADLRNLPIEEMTELIQVDRIEFGRFTRAFDRDEDGYDEGVLAYLHTLDREGDRIKSAGSVQLELWDLAQTAGGGKLGQWHYDITELGDYWLSGPLTYHFKFEQDWPDGIQPGNKNLTIKLTFSDALTGKVFEIQQMVEARIK
ncbi:MAG: hypothetical protein GY869_08935 [Planctomycetes bacterium]|nr:hypothetical protein [Planctomycetota bacterium]